MSGHIGTSKEKSVEWYTPKWIFDHLGIDFDLDPASPSDHETFVPAAVKYTKKENGLLCPWHGRVFMNPPYGTDTPKWMDKFIDHNNGIALVFSRTDARWFQRAAFECDAMLLLAGRVNFVPGHENKHKQSRAGAGTAMFAFGDDSFNALLNLAEQGIFIECRGIKQYRDDLLSEMRRR